MMNDTVAVVIAVALLGFFALVLHSLRDETIAPRRASEAELLALCRRDAEQAERLIELELQLAPHISRDEAIRRAVARYRRDNR